MDLEAKIEVNATPLQTLTKDEIRKTVSAKKKGGKSLRNILGTATKEIWPVVDEDIRITILDDIRNIAFHKKSIKTEEKSSDLKCFIKFGLKEIKRHSKNEKCAAILFDANIPKLLASHSIISAVKNQIPVLCIPNLQEFVTENFGFKSVSIAFLKSESEEIIRIVDRIKVHFDRNFRDQFSKEIDTLKTEDQEMKDVENVPLVTKSEKIEEEYKGPPIVYLPRQSDGKRAFIPTPIVDSNKRIKKTDDDILMLECNNKKLNSEKNTKRSKFRPLVIKKIKPNPDRMNKIKKKKK